MASKMMRKILAATILGILLLATAAPSADLGLSTTSIDYGTVKEGPPVIKTVTLTNNGNQSLTITDAVSS